MVVDWKGLSKYPAHDFVTEPCPASELQRRKYGD
jgi:hypothetical protein